MGLSNMGEKQSVDMFDRDYKPSEITEKTREVSNRESRRFRGSVRVSTGRFFTDEEYEEHSRKISKAFAAK
jgi:hypothetical protein